MTSQARLLTPAPPHVPCFLSYQLGGAWLTHSGSPNRAKRILAAVAGLSGGADTAPWLGRPTFQVDAGAKVTFGCSRWCRGNSRPHAGCYILRPYAMDVWEEGIRDWFSSRIKAMGVKKCYFPLFITKGALEQEANHVEGFAAEVRLLG